MSIINFFINSVNNTLSEPTRLDYPKSINVVRKSIESLIAYKTENQLEYVSYEQTFILVNEISNKFSTKRGLLDELISEGIFSRNLFWISENQYDDGVYLAYERFEDHLTTTCILDANPEIEESFKEDGTLFHLVKDEHSCYMNKGLIEALTIQIPEKTKKEFYEYIPHVKDCYPIVECFVQSLLWRKIKNKTESVIDYVNSCVFSYQGTSDLFWDTILSVTSIPNHYFNAYFLHKYLIKLNLPDRDAWWTIYLKKQFYNGTAIKRLIDWAWNTHDKSHISDEAIKLASITLSWFHTSTNRKLRDSATKALICLLENRIHVLIDLLKGFEKVNDPYIYERLFAVAYGCAVRTEQKEKLTELSDYIFETIFKDKEEVYPHILLRDYARGVIEFTSYLGYDLDFDISIARPPYKSTFPENFPTDEEIDNKYELDYKAKSFKDYFWAQNSILNSMVTEYGRGTGGYGDFGRYTFQSALRTWDVNENTLSNLAVEWIFEKYGYDKDKHGKFDREIGSGRVRSTYPNERIGKKYQWLAFYEMLARVSDNCKKYADWSYQNKEEENYQGSWSPYVRDIDPTMIIQKTGNYDEEAPNDFWWSQEKYANWDLKNEEWIKTNNDLPCSKKLINIMDRLGEEWLVLEGYPEWAESKKVGDEKWDKPHKRMWYQLRSYLISEDNYKKVKKWALHQNFMERWIPENSVRYEVFSREYYWSPAYNYFNDEFTEVYDNLTGKFISKVILTTNDFSWEEEFDKSKEETIGFFKPSKHIYEKMKLVFSKKEGEFIDDTGEIICFDSSVYFDSKHYFLIKKKPFLKYLKENKLRILWTVLGEKNIIGGRSDHNKLYGRLKISGAYFLNKNNDIDGVINTKNI